MRIFTRSRPAGIVRRLTVVAALTSLSLLTACSGESAESGKSTESQSSGKAGDDKGVASVTGGDKKPKEAAQAERPLLRPDMSAEEQERLTQVYTSCLEQHGYKKLVGYSGRVGDPKPDPAVLARNEAKYEPARKACAGKEPESLAERSFREDPNYQDKLDKWLTCMRSHGIKASRPSDEFGVSFDDGMPSGEKWKWVGECEAKAFLAK